MSDRGRGVTRRPFSGKDRSDQNRRTRHSFLGKQTEADRAQFPSVNAGQSQPSVGQPPAAPPYQGSPWFRQFISSRSQQRGQPSTNIADQTVSVSRNTEDWRNQYKDWKDIGRRYRTVTDSLPTWRDIFISRQLAPLPPEELEEFRKHGIEFGKMLGQGGYGSVWQVIKTKNEDGTPLPVPKQCACKILNLYSFKTNRKVSLTQAVDRLKAEASIHRKLSHRNIVRFENVITICDPETDFPYIRLLIFMELCQGDLSQRLCMKKLNESEALNMFRDVCTGLKYLHDKNICHFDIKTGNIMYVLETIGSDGVGRKFHKCYKLADFGLSSQIDPGTPFNKGAVGTFVYMAPEMLYPHLRGKVFNPKATDIYSLGCVLAESMVGVKLWYDLVRELDGKRPEADIFKDYGVPPLCGQLIAWMTRYKADERPTIDEVLKHPWIKSI